MKQRIAPLACFSLLALPAAAQYAAPQYVQQAPNYVTYPQAKPSPYGYAQPGSQSNAPQAYGQQPQYPQQPGQYAQPQYANPNHYDPNQSGPNQYGAGQSYGQADPNQYAQGAPDYGQQYAQPGQYPQPPAQAGQPFVAQQLEQLVAPIALYPDQLVAQILAASTYPAQVIAADNWLHAQGYASPDQVAYAADAQANWDPSIKALTAFPQVLDLMNHDLRWTTDLGNAYYNQPQDVLQTIQVMRQRAQSAGTLESGPQESVSYNQGYIQVAPTNPEVVYVPAYNPWAVYGQPVTPYPGFSLFGTLASLVGDVGGGLGRGFGGGIGAGSFGGGLGGGALRFGLGVALSAFGHTPFGWAAWALNWLTSSIFYHQSPYISASTSVAHWGGGRGGYGGQYAAGGRYGNNGYGSGYGHGPTFTRPPVRTPENPGYNRGGFEAQNQGREYQNRGYENRGYETGRPATPGYAFNRSQQQAAQPRYDQPPARTQAYGTRPGGGYGNGFYGNTQQAYGARPGGSYPAQAVRGPTPAFPRNDLAQRGYPGQPGYQHPRATGGYGSGSYGGSRNVAQSYGREDFGKQQKSGGFHMFGSGHGEQSYHASYKAPKMPKATKAPKMSGGSHHGSGGGFSHHGR